MTDPEQPPNGQPSAALYAEQMLRNDVIAISGLLNSLHNVVLFQMLNPDRPMPRAVLADCADRMERLLTMVRGQLGE